MKDDAIIVRGLSKRFRRHHANRPHSLKEALLRGFQGLSANSSFWALRDISFSIGKGKMVGVIGTNGAGKSTLLRLVGGVGRPDSGSVTTRGRIGALLDLAAGFHPDLTGRENVYVAGVICGLLRCEVEGRMESIIRFAELEEFIDNPIRTYSSGMQMRLGFAVAVHTDPELLLIDEVLAVGDLAFQQKCMEKIKEFKKRGCTIMLISHDIGQVQQFCEEVIWLRSGQIAAQGPPEIVIAEYKAQLANETRRRTPELQPPVRTPSGRELRMNENRFGSMEMEIADVLLREAEGLAVSELASGRSLSISIQYRVSKPITSPIFSVSISRDDGLLCYDTNTAAQGLVLPQVCEDGELTLHLDRLDLAAGKYFVDVGIYEKDWAYGYDYHWHVYPLAVQSQASGKGLLQPPQHWQFTNFSQSKNVESNLTS